MRGRGVICAFPGLRRSVAKVLTVEIPKRRCIRYVPVACGLHNRTQEHRSGCGICVRLIMSIRLVKRYRIDSLIAGCTNDRWFVCEATCKSSSVYLANCVRFSITGRKLRAGVVPLPEYVFKKRSISTELIPRRQSILVSGSVLLHPKCWATNVKFVCCVSPLMSVRRDDPEFMMKPLTIESSG
jgi:hypothetical protein